MLLHPSGQPGKAFHTLIEAGRSLYQGGVTLLVGTDSPNLGTWYGPSMHRELEILVRHVGMSPVEALRAATAATARAFRLDDRGVIAPGQRADLLLVDGNPTVDILATRRIEAVWKGGIRLSR